MNNFVTMQEFGKKGRFGNQILQYMFLYTYARRHGLELFLPQWVGNYLYGVDEKPLPEDRIVTRYFQESVDNPMSLNQQRMDWELNGYFQYHTSQYTTDDILAIKTRLQVTKEVRERLQPAVDQLLALGCPVGLHIRRCDQGVRFFYRTPTSWYKAWLDQYLPQIKNPILFIASDDPHAWKDFAEYHPVTIESLGAELTVVPHAHYNYLSYEFNQGTFDIFPDFYLLQHCRHLAFGNSTFAYAAALLNVPSEQNPDAPKFFRSSLPHGGFIEIDPWDDVPLIQNVDVKDFPQYPEIRMSREEVLKYHKPLARDIFREWGIS